MNCLFRTTTNYSYEEVKRYYFSMIFRPSRIILLIFTELLLAVWSFLSVVYIVLAIFLPVFIFVFTNVQFERIYRSNKLIKNKVAEFGFYDTYFTVKRDDEEIKIEYDKLYNIIETKKNVYLMIAINQGYILNKSNFPEGLSDFLEEIEL